MILFSPATFEIDDEKAAIFGAGCWAQDRTGTTDGMACSISGTGEEIVRANLARSIGAAYKSRAEPHQILQRTLMDLLSEPTHASISRRESDFFSCREEPERAGMEEPAAGVLMITRESAIGWTVQNHVAASD